MLTDTYDQLRPKPSKDVMFPATDFWAAALFCPVPFCWIQKQIQQMITKV